jgi:hypothetical protein
VGLTGLQTLKVLPLVKGKVVDGLAELVLNNVGVLRGDLERLRNKVSVREVAATAGRITRVELRGDPSNVKMSP